MLYWKFGSERLALVSHEIVEEILIEGIEHGVCAWGATVDAGEFGVPLIGKVAEELDVDVGGVGVGAVLFIEDIEALSEVDSDGFDGRAAYCVLVSKGSLVHMVVG